MVPVNNGGPRTRKMGYGSNSNVSIVENVENLENCTQIKEFIKINMSDTSKDGFEHTYIRDFHFASR